MSDSDEQPIYEAPTPLASALETALDDALYSPNRPSGSPVNAPLSLETATSSPQNATPLDSFARAIGGPGAPKTGQPSDGCGPMSIKGDVATAEVQLKRDEPAQLCGSTPTRIDTSNDSSQIALMRHSSCGGDGKPVGADAASGSSPVIAHARGPETTEAQIVREMPDWRSRYVLQLMAMAGNMTLASRITGVSIDSARYRVETDPVFARWVAHARRSAGDLVEAALHISATTGDPEPVFQGGVCVGHKRRKSVDAAKAILASERVEWRNSKGGETTTTNNQVNIAVNVARDADEVRKLADAATARLFRGTVIEADADEVPTLE